MKVNVEDVYGNTQQPESVVIVFFTNPMNKFVILIHLLHSSTRFEH